MEEKFIYLENVKNIGPLYLEPILYSEFDNHEVSFICSDKNDNLYLCLYSESNYSKDWYVTETTTSIIRNLIDKKIDFFSAYTKYSKKAWLITEFNDENGEIVKNYNQEIKIGMVNPLILPKRGVFIKCSLYDTKHLKELKEFLRKYERIEKEKTKCL